LAIRDNMPVDNDSLQATARFFTIAKGRTWHQMSEIESLQQQLADAGYIADTDLATVIHLAQVLTRPLLLEGDAGVGKTAVAASLARALGRPFVRLQCYEGLDANAALYEWNFQRQLMAIKLRESSGSNDSDDSVIFSREYLLPRPLLSAITSEQPAVLLIDEIDRADDEFEAFLLEVLAEFQITIPELGTITAIHKPLVILTSNATRDLSDALRRRCLFHFVDYPSASKELQILHRRIPDLDEALARSVVAFVQRIRAEHLKKSPGIAEALDWAAALLHTNTTQLGESLPQIEATLGCLLKPRADREIASREWLQEMLNSEQQH